CLAPRGVPFACVSTRKYVPVVSQEQCQSYENDFNAEFDEYRRLHAQIDAEVKKFTKFQEQWKLLSPGSQEYMVKKVKILVWGGGAGGEN
ncbi:ELL2 factor, partial [Ramphastos sulfuratus]|nr:ELL2 factor [Ramphastos sulfuratus]